VNAHDSEDDAARVLTAKDHCLALLTQKRAAGLFRRRFFALYGQVLDVEDTAALRRLWKEIQGCLPATRRTTGKTSSSS
jgi:hypothetical protein